MAQTNPQSDPVEPTIEDLDLDNIELEPIDEEIVKSQASELELIPLKQEDTRGKLALFFVIGFFLVLLSGIIVSALEDTNRIESLKEVILAISGILSGPLGFVIGYYFRSKED